MSIAAYMDDLENVQDQYQRYWVNPYGSCYAIAHDRFRRTLDDQAKVDRLKAQCVMLIASVAFGGGMSALFGAAVVRTVLVDQALQVVCNRNMNRLFNAMAWVESSPAASFMTQAAWDGVAGMLSDQTTSQLENLAFSRPSLNGIQNPQAFQNDLQNYVLDCKLAAYATAREVRDSGVLSAAGRDQIADDLRAAPFFANAPTSDVIRDKERAKKEMELLLYMTLVMGSDFLVEESYWMRGAHEGHSTRTIGPVTAATGSPNYPQGSYSHSSGLGYFSDTFRKVDYRRPGGDWFSSIMDRTNELHRDLFGREFEHGSYGKDEVTRAQNLSQRIQTRYYASH